MNITPIQFGKARQRVERAASASVQVSDADLAAYVEGTLDADAQARLEGFLACNPDLAAEVMRQWHRRARVDEVVAAHRPAARSRGHMVVVAFFCMAAGWVLAEGLDDDGPFRDLSPTPEYVDDALMSKRVTHVRIGMNSQPESLVLDSAEIEHATRIRLPLLPAGWQLVDAQVYPSDEGPSLSVLLEVEPGRRVNLFAVPADSKTNGEPVVTRQAGESVAYWESGDVAFVLSGEGSSRGLLADARMLSGHPR